MDKYDDMIDSRDVIERIKELEDERQEFVDAIEEAQEALAELEEDLPHCGDEYELELQQGQIKQAEEELTIAQDSLTAWDQSDEGDELRSLQSLASQAEGYAEDWLNGATLIRDSYFKTYAQEFADDIGAINADSNWPNNHIDWDAAAADLQQDYTSVDFDGITYWVR